MIDIHKIDNFTRSYITTMLWAETDQSNDQGGDPLDANYSGEDIDEDSLERIVKDCKAFQDRAASLLDGLDLETAGHDFWLTRNGHGAGFWDGDYKKDIGEALTKLSKQFDAIDVVVGDDGKLHVG